jgi:hypothetical protein
MVRLGAAKSPVPEALRIKNMSQPNNPTGSAAQKPEARVVTGGRDARLARGFDALAKAK